MTPGHFVPASGGYTVSDLEKLGFTENSSAGVIGVIAVTLWVEAVKPSEEVGDQLITATFTEGGGPPLTCSASVTAVAMDLLDDADNTDQPDAQSSGTSGGGSADAPDESELPDDTPDLEATKDLPTDTGKILVVNTSDTNGNGIPDFADGYGLSYSQAAGLSGPFPSDTANPDQHFVPLEVKLPPIADPDLAEITFAYSGSDPGGVTVSADAFGQPVFTPAAGILRIWDKVGSYQDGTQGSPRTVADYVEPGQAYPLSDLGYTDAEAANDQPLVLYMEAVRPGAGQITATVDADGAAPSQTVNYTAVNAQAAGSTAFSGAVNLADGNIATPAVTDLSSNGFGAPWALTRTYTNEPVLSLQNSVGNGWSSMPYLIQGDSTVIVAGMGQGAEYFDATWDANGNPILKARFGILDQLSYNPTLNRYTLVDTSGNETAFNGFGAPGTGGALTNSAPEGGFLKYTTAYGNTVTAVYHTVNCGQVPLGAAQQYQLTTLNCAAASGSGTGGTAQDVYTYSWNAPTGSGPVQTPGMLDHVTLAGPSGNIETATYAYYGTGDPLGGAGNLQTATVSNAAGTIVAEDYYVYAGGGLAYVFDSTSIARMNEADYTVPLNSPDDLSSVTQFAEYAISGNTQTIQGAGASSKSSLDAAGTYSYSFAGSYGGGVNTIPYAVGVNAVANRVTVTPPGEAPQVIATNFAGETVSSSTTVSDSSSLNGKTWTTHYAYNPSAQLTTTTLPSGLKQVTEYYPSPPSSSQPVGYVEDTELVSPSGATALQTYATYAARTAGGFTIYPVASSSVYSSQTTAVTATDRTTSESYTYAYGGFGPSQIDTTLPHVSDEGSGQGADDTLQDFNSLGLLVDSFDPVGNETNFSSDPSTGATTMSVVDHDGLDLITHTSVDIYGRPTLTIDPDGDRTSMTYVDGLYDSKVTTTPENPAGVPVGPATVVDDNEAAGTITTTKVAAPSDGGGVVGKTVQHLDYAGRTVATDQYYDIGNSLFYPSTQTYNSAGLPAISTDNVGTITVDNYDSLGRESTVYIGTSLPTYTSPGNLTLVEQLTYDGGNVGDGNVTQDAKFTGTYQAPARVTQMAYDWEDRRVATQAGLTLSQDGAVTPDSSTYAPITCQVLDNLGEVTATLLYAGLNLSVSQFAGVSSGSFTISSLGQYLRGASSQTFDARGRVYGSSTYSVDPQNGVSGSPTLDGIEGLPALTTTATFDAEGDVLTSTAPTGVVTTNQYDSASRKSYTSEGDGTTVYSSVTTTYDADGNPTATVEQDLMPGTPATYRSTYGGSYYDADGRLTATVNFGTSAALASQYASAPPARFNAGPLVTGYTYDPAGFKATVTDPNNTITMYANDALGRPTKVYQNYGGTPANATENLQYTYDGLNHVTSTTVLNILPGGNVVPQTTNDVYGVVGGFGYELYDNDLLAQVQYPGYVAGSATAAATSERYGYDDQGDKIFYKDRNRVYHSYFLDALGRVTRDSTGSSSAGTDSAIQGLDYQFDAAGNATLFSSLSSNLNPVNQVQRTYNGFGQITSEQQNDTGPVTSAGTLTTSYGYSSPATGSLETSVTYPDGRTEAYAYSGIGQVTSLADGTSSGSTVLETYQYLGLSSIVGRTRPQEGITEATGLDTWGRVNNVNWFTTTGGASATVDGYAYVRDSDGDVTYRVNLTNIALPKGYGYDGMERQTSFTLDPGTGTAVSWNLDSLGNKYGGPYAGVYNSFDETGTSSTSQAANTITLAGGGQQVAVKYDSWDRVATTADSNGGTLNPNRRYVYDALGRMIDFAVTDGNGTVLAKTRLLYDGNNVIEERDNSGNVSEQFVWAPDGTLVLRDRDNGSGAPADSRIPQGTNSNGSATTLNERIYALSDAAGSITTLTDITGNILLRFTYNQDGLPALHNPDWSVLAGSSAATWTTLNWEYLYHGMRYQTMDYLTPTPTATAMVRCGLYTSGAGTTWYDPTQGRNLQPDTSAYQSGQNAYVDNSDYVQSGQAEVDKWLIGGAVLGLGAVATVLTGGLAGGLIGGALGGWASAYGAGCDLTQQVEGAAIGGAAGAAGAAVGSAFGAAAGAVNNALGLTCANGLGRVGGFISGAVEGGAFGFTSGFAQNALTTGNFDSALSAGLSGAEMGAGIGGVLGALSNACFAAGTPMLLAEEIALPDGTKSAVVAGSLDAEKIRQGHLFLSGSEFDPSAPLAAKVVEEVFVRAGVIFLVYLGGRVIRTTPEHEFMVRDKGRIPATELEPGDMLPGHKGGWTAVERTENTGKVEPVYNFRVADYHTYFVGSPEWGFSVWVHNAYLRPGEEFVGEFNNTRDGQPVTKESVEEAVRQGTISERSSGPSIAIKPGPLGGAYDDVPANGGEAHHAIADAISPLDTGQGRSWRMDSPDHYLTASWGSSPAAEAYRQMQRTQIDNGDFWEAFDNDAADTRAIANITKSDPTYYDQGIGQARAYAQPLDPARLFPVQGAD